MQLQHIMTTRIVTVESDDKLSVIKGIFDQHLFHHLLVVDNKVLSGIISDRDLFKALSPNLGTKTETERDAATLNKRAHQIMTRAPITLTAEHRIADAIAIFARHKISCIPIVDSQLHPVGIVSWRDILKAMPDPQ